MTKVMPINQIEEKLRWIKPVLTGQLSVDQVMKICPFSRRTLFNWLKRYEKYGKLGLVNQSTRPRTNPNATSKVIAAKIIDLHCDNGVGALKIKWLLQKQEINISDKTVQRILNRHGLVKPRRPANKQKYQPKIVTQPGELVEIDIKYGVNFGFNRWWYQYTALDVASRWRLLSGFSNMETNYTIDFVNHLFQAVANLFTIKAIKTDNGAVFTNRLSGLKQDLTYRQHALDIWCINHCIDHYLISPGCPTQNAHVERSHRSDQEYFYNHLSTKPASLDEYNYQLRLWNACYNDLPHCGLKGLSPNQYLAQYF
jgi:transposase InsO family protein